MSSSETSFKQIPRRQLRAMKVSVKEKYKDLELMLYIWDPQA